MINVKRKRILLVDDNAEIHKDFCKILTKENSDMIDEGEAILFGLTKTVRNGEAKEYNIDSAYQGKEALELVKKALLASDPYALAFIDMRMPPGWDGIETIKRLWEVDPNIQMVICSAYSEHSWSDITRELGNSDNLLILKKPFEAIEINQLASALTKKWELIARLNEQVKHRTAELENLYSLTHTALESTQEGILAVAFEGHTVTYNQNFLNQWGVSEALVKTEKLSVVFEKLAEKLDAPALFLKMMNDLILKPQAKHIKEWQLKTGTLLELYTQPQYLHDEIIGVFFSFQDITERKALEKKLIHQASHDTLTGLPNRVLLLDRIKQALAHADRFGLRVCILLIDLDFFKEVNDSFGHKNGDLLLKCLAKRLTGYSHNIDTVARLGGDEFVVVLTAQSREDNFVENISKFMELFIKPYQLENKELTVTASSGVSIYPQDGRNADTLLKNANYAMCHAKELGRNRLQFYMKEFNEHILQRAELKVALNHALIKNEFSLNYQPLIDLKTNQIIGVEALLRWEHPTIGFISPLTFIPVAEESGLILPIGEWVLKAACTQAHLWHTSSAFPDIKISVNISVKQFRQNEFVAYVRKILDETKLRPECLELEITESLILGNISEVIGKMLELKELGVRFAIDDFGTGYSSLSYLKHFPFDTIKIDKTFMDNISTDVHNAAIVEAIIAMTKNMSIDVLAEGVEESVQVDFLRTHHSDQVQGYYFSKPLSMEACTELLNKQMKSK